MLAASWTRYNFAMCSAQSAYVVRWTGVAADELCSKVKADDVARELHAVTNTALDDMTPPDGGQAPPLCWRRGITTQHRAQLDAAEAAGFYLDDGNEKSWDYVLVYRRDPNIRKLFSSKTAYVIVGILSNAELLAGALDMDDLQGRTTA